MHQACRGSVRVLPQCPAWRPASRRRALIALPATEARRRSHLGLVLATLLLSSPGVLAEPPAAPAQAPPAGAATSSPPAAQGAGQPAPESPAPETPARGQPGTAGTTPPSVPAQAEPAGAPTFSPPAAQGAGQPAPESPAPETPAGGQPGTAGTAPPPAAPSPGSVEPIPFGEAVGVLGKKVWGPDGSYMGLLVDVLVDKTGQPRAAVIDFGGFLGVGSRKIAVDWQLLQFNPADAKVPIQLGVGRAEVKSAPEYKPADQPAGKPAEAVGPPAPPGEPAVPNAGK